MIAAIPFSARCSKRVVEPPEGVLLRVALDALPARQVPPAPPGADITVSLSRAAARSAGSLEGLGYRCVGVAPASGRANPVADFLVADAVLDRHPQWCEEMTAHADRIFRLAFGPALAALADVLDVHRA